MNVVLVQTPIVWENKEANFAMAHEMLADVSCAEGSLIVFPELFAMGFTLKSREFAESDLGPTEQFLIDLAREKRSHVVGGMATVHPDKNKPFNCSVIASPDGKILCRYRKMHPFSLGDEDKHYSAGDRVEILKIEGITVCPAICYDLRFPELFRAGSQRGAEVYVVIANWPEKRNHHWIGLLQARAIENQAYVIGVNRSGEDPNLVYKGSSMVVDYMGDIVADAGNTAKVIQTELNIDGLREWRANFPALRDRNPVLLG
jgi:omega-amidase